LLGIGLFPCEADVRLDVAGDGGQLIVRGNLLFRAFAIAQNGLRGFLIVPKIGLSNLSFERFQAFPELGRVKDSSARG
jgi:hypothetical protein